jgi:hypothetical protein
VLVIFVAVGLPGRFAEWCERTLCALVEASFGELETAVADTLDQIALTAVKTSTANLVIAARQPSADLRAALAASERRFVVALDDPYAAFGNLIADHRLDWRTALRAAAGSCAALASCAALPGALVLRAGEDGRDRTAAATAMAEWFGLDPAKAAALQGPVHPAPASAAGGPANRHPPGVVAAIDGALAGYVERFGDGAMGPLVWRRELFFIGDKPKETADRAIDVGGPVRYLLYGPYLALPPGLWSGTVVLAVSRAAANVSYSFEVLAGARFECLARGTLAPSGEGVCETTVEFAVGEATGQPIEIRIANLQPAFDGRLAMVHVALTPRRKARVELPAELTSALGL